MPEYDPTQLPPELIAAIDEVENELFTEDHDSIGLQIVLETFDHLPKISLINNPEYSVRYEDAQGVHTLLPEAITNLGMLCTRLDHDGDVSYVMVLGSLYIPGYNDKWRNIIEANRTLPSVVYSDVGQPRKVLLLDTTDGLIFERSVCANSYLVTTDAYLDTDDIPEQDVDPEVGYSIPEAYSRITALHLSDKQPIVIYAPINANLSISRIGNIAAIDKDGTSRPITASQE